MTALSETDDHQTSRLTDSPCSHLRIAYVIGGDIDQAHIDRVEAGKHPKVEYFTFLARNQADVITYKDVRDTRSLRVKMWRSSGKKSFALAALAVEQAHNYDAILVSGEDIGFPMALAMLARVRKTPIFIITHGSYFGSRKFKQFSKLLRRISFVHFLCLADSLCKILTDDSHIPKDRVHNTGYGVDTSFFKTQKSDQLPVIASAGTANRDYQTLVQATDKLGINLVIAVDSEWFPSAVDIRSEDVPAYVEARSFGDYLSLRDLYARAAVVVVPLYPAKHACGYAVIAEAMAMGKCVIATSTESASDFIEDGVSGFYVPVQDAAALRDRLQRLLNDPSLIASAGQAARKRIEELFSLDAYCRRIESAIASSTKRGS